MNGPSRLLFLAGESGTGKSTVGRSLEAHGLLLYADLITKRAGPHYFPTRQENFCRWSLWTSELDNELNHSRLIDAFRQSMRERKGLPIEGHLNLIVEGAVVGHPEFRKLVRHVMEVEYSVAHRDVEVATLWLDPTASELLDNIRRRNRSQDRHVSLEHVEQRLARYAALMSEQPVVRFQSAANCGTAALAFLTDGPRRA